LGATVTALVVIVAATLLLLRSSWRAPQQTPRVAAKPVPAPTPPPPRPAPETLYIAPPANPGDSSDAAAFTVELQVANTAEGANLFIRKNGGALPAPAVSPVPIDP